MSWFFCIVLEFCLEWLSEESFILCITSSEIAQANVCGFVGFGWNVRNLLHDLRFNKMARDDQICKRGN